MARRWPILLMAPVLAGAGPSPSRVTYVLGGVVSGPYRLSADLRAGTVEEARPPPGRHGDGAALDPWTMPATTRRRLAAADAARIARLAGSVWQDGIRSATRCPPTVPPSLDALVAFAVTAPGGTRRFDTAAPCMTDIAATLQRLLHDAATP